MIVIRTRTHLDADTLAAVLGVIDAATRADGHRPVGEHKYAHLSVGARSWTGVLAYDGDRLAGYAHVRWNALGRHPRMAVEAVVHPDYRTPDDDVACHLLDEVRHVLAEAGGGTMYLWVHRVDDPEDTLAARMGFAVQRELAFMTRALDAPPQADPPPGVELRPYRPGDDDDALLQVNNAAFEGHPENGGWDAAELERRLRLDWFEPDGVLLAWRGGELLGFHWTKWHGHDSDEVPAHEPVGEVYILGVHPRASGSGVGRNLLAAGLRHLYERGCRLAVLYVDMASARAVELYRRSGFDLQYREVCYERLVAPSGGFSEDLSRPL
jgi:mycothiol synthase